MSQNLGSEYVPLDDQDIRALEYLRTPQRAQASNAASGPRARQTAGDRVLTVLPTTPCIGCCGYLTGQCGKIKGRCPEPLA